MPTIGAIEWDELPSEAAVRETREEAGIDTALDVAGELDAIDYAVGEPPPCKRVRYFRLISADALALGPLPRGTRERCRFGVDDVPTIPLVNEALRPLLLDALSMETE